MPTWRQHWPYSVRAGGMHPRTAAHSGVSLISPNTASEPDEGHQKRASLRRVGGCVGFCPPFCREFALFHMTGSKPAKVQKNPRKPNKKALKLSFQGL